MENGFFSLINGHMVLGAAIPLVAVAVFFLHELGHYVAARLCRVHVENITVGVGREIWRRTDRRGTLWLVRAFPICGFVHVAQKKEGEEARHGVFCYQPLWKRALIVAAGPLTNLLLAWFMFTLFFVTAGQPSVPPYVVGVERGSPAEQAGFRTGDRLLAMEGRPVERFDDVWAVTADASDRKLSFTLLRKGEKVETEVTPVHAVYTDLKGFSRSHGRIGAMHLHEPLSLDAITAVGGVETGGDPARTRELLRGRMDSDTVIGVHSDDGAPHYYDVHILAALNEGMADPASRDYGRVYLGATKHNFYFRRGLIDGMTEGFKETARLVSGVAGVVGRMTGADNTMVAPQVWVSRDVSPWRSNMFIVFYAGICLSISIALMNLLPIPGFDGGALLRYLVEAVLGPARADVVAPYVTRMAFLFLIGVMMLINREAIAMFMH